jgi:AraC-like DNA-binding protein
MVPHGATVIGSSKAFAADVSVGLTLYLLPALCDRFPNAPTVLRLTSLMHEILDRMRQWPQNKPLTDQERRLLEVFIDEVQAARPEPLRLIMPVHRQLSIMASRIADDPADRTSIEEWGHRLGMSGRTITRKFREETGSSVSEWRQVARMQKALELLSDGESVTNIALTLGYDSISSFIALFKRIVDSTPAKFAANVKAV